jgi:alpha-glucosidase
MVLSFSHLNHNTMIRTSLLLFYLLISLSVSAQKSFTLKSPDSKVSLKVDLDSKTKISVSHEQDVVISPSSLSMKISTGEQLGVNPQLKKVTTKSVKQTIETKNYKRSSIAEQYNELTLDFKNDFSFIARVYNDGVAYRFATRKKNDFQVIQEEAPFNFPGDQLSIIPYVRDAKPTFEEQFMNSFENTYTTANLSGIDASRLIFLPAIVSVTEKKKLCITEVDLEEYPGMYLAKSEGNSLKGVFAGYPKKVEQGGHNNLQVLVREREHFIAKVKGTRSFPWRVMIITTDDKQLADNDMVYKLASPSRIDDKSWIKPGKVAWDWWNDWNIYNVNFRAGINNDTYKYYIDFASTHNIEYVILDEGWAVNMEADLLKVVPEIDIKALVDYGKTKNVGIILWAGYYALDRNMETVCKYYSEIGVKGFKVDFMDRDDQVVVDFYYRAAEMAAKYKLLVDYHGAYKPTGLFRTWPNVINSEGVFGLEQLKWSTDVDMVKNEVTIPFIRMVAGPLDYTQGAMRNATKSNFRPVNSEPMSQGTRCHQLAMYVVYESPLNMLCDNPSNYMREEECTKFISSVPTTWDNSFALDGKVGEYIATARQKGKEWYVGAMTNWTAREISLDLSFLPEGKYKVEIFADGINADHVARDYTHETIPLQGKMLKAALAPGGGFVARIFQE